jgi:hypothetical protein
VRQLIAYEPPSGPVKVSRFGTIHRSGYRIVKLVYESEPGIAVPALLYLPQGQGKRPAAVYVHGRGKTAAEGDIEQLAAAGLIVLAIDARGFGETRHHNDDNGSDWPRYFGDYDCAMTALLSRRTLAGMRARDIVCGVQLLAVRADVDPARISGFGVETAAAPLLHAAFLDSRIRSIGLERMLVSYQSVVDRPIHRGVFENVIPGVLKKYDLPDLAAALAPRRVWVVDALDPLGQRAPLAEVRKHYAGGHVVIQRRHEQQPVADLYRGMLG